MDTGSHLLFGTTLAGMAFYCPAFADQPMLAAAVITATLAGSVAPDLDSFVRLKSDDAYWRNHRGITHSLPALLVWAAAVGSLAAWGWGFPEHLLMLCGYALAAAGLHVFFDWTNAYGVQCLLPFRKEWVHLDSLCLTDPYLAVVHAATVVGAAVDWWLISESCASAWGITAVYIIWRITHHEIIVRRLRHKFGRRLRALHVLPGLWWFRWQYAVQTDEGFELGMIEGQKLKPSRRLPPPDNRACVDATRQLSAVRTLHFFAKRKYVFWKTEPNGEYLVTWTDVRFWGKRDWPYRAEVRLDSQLNVLEQRIGWHKKAWQAPYV